MKQPVRRPGQSMVEIALFMPLLVFITLLAVDFGRVFYSVMTITNATRVGAEFAIDPRRSPSEVRNIIRQEGAPFVVLTDTDIIFNPSSGWTAGQELHVSVGYRFKAITPFIANLWGGGLFPITRETVIRFTSP
ncbi:MAG: pilus assembly protein [Chloroflexi bacterium]|nr:pilus assembly protein [Chloroflexota bacterium]